MQFRTLRGCHIFPRCTGLVMLSVYDRYKLTCGINPKFGAISSFHNMYISTLQLANQCFPSAVQLRKTKLQNQPTGTKNTEIIGDGKKSIVCDSGAIISAGLRFYKIRFYKIQHNSIQHNCVYVVVYVCRNACVWVFYLVETNLVETKACYHFYGSRSVFRPRPENISLTVETDRSLPRYTIYYFCN